MVRCPGQDQRFWKPGDIFELKCPGCGKGLEFWKDEPDRKCRSCGKKVRNPRIDLGCAEWCQYAEQCIGSITPDGTAAICDKLITQMKAVFDTDQKRIDHALSVLNHAGYILADEGGDPIVVKAAAILHDIGIHEAEKKHNSAAGKYQEIEGPPIARQIMADLDLDDKTIDHVCKIITNHHSAKDIDTIEFQILWDADWLINFPDEFAGGDKDATAKRIDRIFKTKTGRQMATKLFAA